MNIPAPRRAAAAAAALALAVGALTGCAASSQSGGDSKSLVLLTYSDATSAKALRTGLADFKKKTGISVTLNTLPGTGAAVYPNKLRTSLVGGKGPDAWLIWGGTLGAPFADNGFAVDLGKYYSKYGWDKRIPKASVTGMTWNDKKYGLPVYSRTVTAWYSKADWAKAGITSTPTTYDELLADNEKLKAAGLVPLGLGGKFGWDLMRLFEYLLEKNAGPELHDKLLTGKASWNNPAVVKSFQDLKLWNDKGYLPDGVLGLDPTDVEPGFTQGKSTYTIAGAWVDSQFVQLAADPSAYGTFALPTDQKPLRHSGWVEGFMINAASKKQDNAAKLLDYLSQKTTQPIIENTSSTVEGAGPDPDKFPVSAESAKIGAEQPFFTIQDQALPADISNAYFQLQSEVVQGTTTPQDAAKKMQDAVSKASK